MQLTSPVSPQFQNIQFAGRKKTAGLLASAAAALALATGCSSPANPQQVDKPFVSCESSNVSVQKKEGTRGSSPDSITVSVCDGQTLLFFEDGAGNFRSADSVDLTNVKASKTGVEADYKDKHIEIMDTDASSWRNGLTVTITDKATGDVLTRQS